MAEQRITGYLLYQKYADLLEYAYKITKKYPRSEKYTLVHEIKESMYKVIKLLVHVVKTKNKKREKDYLDVVDGEVSLQKILVRISY